MIFIDRKLSQAAGRALSALPLARESIENRKKFVRAVEKAGTYEKLPQWAMQLVDTGKSAD